jgi:Uma2 family endonuclease
MALALDWGAPLTVEDLDEAPDDGHRYELVDGTLLVTPAPGTDHQTCVAALVILLSAAAGPDLRVLPGPYDWVVSASTLLQPDVLVARRTDLGPKRLEKAPLLVVEVSSPSTRSLDRGTKRLAYEAAGVGAYWLVDPEGPSLSALRLASGRFVDEAHVSGEEAFDATWPMPVRVVPADLLA